LVNNEQGCFLLSGANTLGMNKQYWEERYADKEYAYGRKPNVFFRQFINGFPPGKILFPAEGEGRNAVFAATKGWQVFAFDFSEKAKEKAMKLAKKNKVHINYFNADIENVFLEEKRYNAIALLYAHMPPKIRRKVHRRLVGSLKPKGMLILEAFSKAQLHKSSGGPKDIDMLFSIEDLYEDFNSMTIQIIAEEKTRLNHGKYHQGIASVIRILAIKL